MFFFFSWLKFHSIVIVHEQIAFVKKIELQKDAFGLEFDAFADTLLYSAIVEDEKERRPLHAMWPITSDQCINVQKIVDAARESCELGQAVDVSY